MRGKVVIGDEVYLSMLDYIHTLSLIDSVGLLADTHFIDDDFWLQNTAVIENIEHRNGLWNIYLVFAHHAEPLKFIKRKIVNYTSFKKASLAAQYMRRLAAKDQRGTLLVNKNLITLNFN